MTPEFCRALLTGRLSRPVRGSRRFARISGETVASLKASGLTFQDIADQAGTHEAWILKQYARHLRNKAQSPP